MTLARSAALALAFALAASGCASAQEGPVTRSLQGDTHAFGDNPHVHRIWERLRVACAQGCAKADAAAFQREVIVIAREMAPGFGMTPDQMAEHVRLIPGQLLKIGQEDPAILTDYDTFVVALVGPA